jgi:hypothetical protein
MLFDARQRHLLQENLERLVDLLEVLAGELASRSTERAWGDPKLRRYQIRTTVLGVLTSVALAQDEALQQEIASFKDLIKRLQYVRFGEGEPK